VKLIRICSPSSVLTRPSSGEVEYGGRKVTEVSLNGFPSSRIVDMITDDPYRFLIAATYNVNLNEDEQVTFKGKAKAYVRMYVFLASILPYSDTEWEKLATFLTFLAPKLPAPKEDDLSRGILQDIDMESYRAEVKSAMRIELPDEDSAIGTVPTWGGARIRVPELDRLSNIVKAFNEAT
jgi:type I restriction enzyme, R subunit